MDKSLSQTIRLCFLTRFRNEKIIRNPARRKEI
jgi:hypothetical protein